LKRLLVILLACMLVPLLLASCIQLNTTPSASPASVAPSAAVEVKGQTYTHAGTGFTITYPEDWTMLGDAAIGTAWSAVITQINNTYTDAAEIAKAMRENVPVTVAMLHPTDYTGGFNANINVILQENVDMTGFPGILEVADMSLEQANQQYGGGYQTEKAQAVKVGGQDAALVGLSQTTDSVTTLQKQYYMVRDNDFIVVTLTSQDPADMATLQKAVDSIHFN
jgi:hypothetical protein